MTDTKVYSEYPVIVQYVGARKKTSSNDFLSMDGTTNPKQVLAFQKWTNKFKFKEKKLAEDGKWGPKTSAAWNQFGEEYLNAGKSVAGVVDGFSNQFKSSESGSAESTAKVSLLDKALGLFGKGKEAVGKVKDATGKIKRTVGPGAGSAGEYQTSESTPDAPTKSNTKKILIIAGVGVGIAAIIYFATRPKTSKA